MFEAGQRAKLEPGAAIDGGPQHSVLRHSLSATFEAGRIREHHSLCLSAIQKDLRIRNDHSLSVACLFHAVQRVNRTEHLRQRRADDPIGFLRAADRQRPELENPSSPGFTADL